MKKKSRHAILKRKHEFRFHNVDISNRYGRPVNIKHPAYVFLEKGNIYVYLTITHSSYVDNYVVVKLRKNPNPKDKKDAYYVAEIREDTKDRFTRRLKTWKIDPIDDQEIQAMYKKK